MAQLSISFDNSTATVDLDAIASIADWFKANDNLGGSQTTCDGARRTGGGSLITASWVPGSTGFVNAGNGQVPKSLTYAGTIINTGPASGTDNISTYSNTGGVGFTMTFPVDAGITTIYVFGTFFSGGAGTLTATLSDSSAGPATSTGGGGDTAQNFTITAQAGSAGQTLTVTWIQSAGFIMWGATAMTTSVAQGPVITAQPQPVSTYVGNTATFNVTATGTGTLHYQWKKDGSNVGTDSSSYTTPTLDMTFNGAVYTVVVTDDNGSTTSNGALLTVYIVAAVAWIRA